jgi:PAS domain S-box-containing protein
VTGTSTPLRVLIVEDSEEDALLLRAELRRHGYVPDFERVETDEAMRRALQRGPWDIILSDYRLPHFSGPAALAVLQESGLDVPLIIISGTVGEETAVAVLKAGAADFVTKDNLSRLCPAIEREVREGTIRRDLRRAEEALKVSEERLRSLFGGIDDALFVHDEGGRIIDCNEAACRRLGYTRSELLTMRTSDVDAPEFAGGFGDRLAEQLHQGRIAYEGVHVTKDGRRIPVDISTSVIDFRGTKAVLAIMRDITSRKKAEEELGLQNLILATQQETSLDGILIVDEQARIVSFNQRFLELWRIPPEIVAARQDRLLLESVLHRVVEPDAFLARVEHLYAHPDEKSSEEIQLKDGRTFDRYSAGMVGADGRYYGRVWYFRDITGRKQIEEALRRSEAEYRGLVEYAPLGIFRSTLDGRFLTVNTALVRMLGYESAEQLLERSLPRDIYVDPQQRTDLLLRFRKEEEARTEALWRCRDDTSITVQLNVRIVRSSPGRVEYIEGLVENVTTQRNLENQFRQAQRLEAVGRLAGGVAHDFNNILTAIVAYSDMLLQDFGAEDPKRADVEEIRSAAQRAAGLTRQLLAFSRRQVLQLRVLSLNGVVEAVDNMLQRLIGEDVTLVVRQGDNLGAVRADPGQIEQVILNLAVNARDAMPQGGQLTIETSNVELDAAFAEQHPPLVPGPYVQLAVSDTGTGMDAETKAHLFEPFFTTKELGKGTGLGLATVYGIIKQSKGFVWVYSELGRGATFKIYLPRVDAPLDAPDMAPAAKPAAGGHETILLAEDDPAVRHVISEVLTQQGYRVLSAPDGASALAVARAHPGEIQLLVTDMVMPGMTGRELAETLLAGRPAVRVIYTSGYTDDAVVRHGVLEAGMLYLQKPFTPNALAFKVREALDRPPSA